MAQLINRGTVVASVVVLAMAGALGASAQTVPTLPPTTSPTTSPASSTTTTSSPSTTTTTLFGGTGSGSTSTTAPASTTTAPPSTTTSTGDLSNGGDANFGPVVAIPPQYQAYIDQVKRSPANDTKALLAGLQPLEDLGLSQDEAIAATFGHFPVAGVANWTDDWWYPRYNIPFHLHQGTDIFAPLGTPIRAPGDGALRHANGGLGGQSVYVTQADGTYFYMAHLSAFVDGQPDGLQVKTGEIIGYVGNTGDAAGGATHLHFEIHMDPRKNVYLRPPPPAPKPAIAPRRTRNGVTTSTTRAPTTTTAPPARRGRRPTPTTTTPPPVIIGDINDRVLYGSGALPATDPKPFLDQWIAEDLIHLPAVIAAAEAGHPRAIIATGLTRRFADGHAGQFAAPTGPPQSQLLWTSAASPEGGVLHLAVAAATRAAGEIDVSALVRAEAAHEAERRAAAIWARALLDPLTPPALRLW